MLQPHSIYSRQILRDVVGCGQDISSSNPLPAGIPKPFTNLIPLIRFSTPILSPGVAGAWDDVDIHSHCLFRDINGKYWLYYNGRKIATSGIGLATSTDGINFTKHPNNPLLTPTPDTWEADGLWKMDVLRFSSSDYRMWYGAHGGKIGYATSTDGVNWTKHSENPIFSGAADFKVVCDKDTGEFRCIYYNGKCNLATSPDGIHWTAYPNNPVMVGEPNSWEEGGISPKHLIKLGNLFVLAYEGCGNYSEWRFGLAYSYDLVNWFKDSRNPILSWGIPGGEDDRFVSDPVFLYEAEGWGRCYYGTNSSVAGPEGRRGYIGLAYFAFETPIRLSYNILTLNSLAGGAISDLTDCMAVFLHHAKSIELTVEETYHASATAGGKLYLHSSVDGVDWDTEPIESARTLAFVAGATKRETFTPSDAAQRAAFLRCRYENMDTLTDFIIEDCEDAWNEQVITGVTSELDTEDKKVGNGSVKLTMTDAAGIGVLASEVVSLAGNTLDDYDQLVLWIKSSIAAAANQLQILLDDTANLASPVATINIPALSANVWTQCLITADFSGCTALTIISVGVKQVSDLGAFTLWLDDLRATRRISDIGVTATLGV